MGLNPHRNERTAQDISGSSFPLWTTLHLISTYKGSTFQNKVSSLSLRAGFKGQKFVKNSLINTNFAKLFPLRKVKHEMKFRMSEKYFVNPSLLNKDNLENRQKSKRLLDYESSLCSGKKQRLEQKKLVNYVSNVDVITWENKILFIYLFKGENDSFCFLQYFD